MAKLGFLGLGIMGYPMARNLLKAGHDVGLWSHTEAKAHELADAAGGRFCATPADAADGAECVFLCVGDSRMSEEVILGEERDCIEGKERRGNSGREHGVTFYQPADRGEAYGKRLPFSGCAVHRIESRLRGGNPDVHDRRRQGSLRPNAALL